MPPILRAIVANGSTSDVTPPTGFGASVPMLAQAASGFPEAGTYVQLLDDPDDQQDLLDALDDALTAQVAQDYAGPLVIGIGVVLAEGVSTDESTAAQKWFDKITERIVAWCPKANSLLDDVDWAGRHYGKVVRVEPSAAALHTLLASIADTLTGVKPGTPLVITTAINANFGDPMSDPNIDTYMSAVTTAAAVLGSELWVLAPADEAADANASMATLSYWNQSVLTPIQISGFENHTFDGTTLILYFTGIVKAGHIGAAELTVRHYGANHKYTCSAQDHPAGNVLYIACVDAGADTAGILTLLDYTGTSLLGQNGRAVPKAADVPVNLS